jgi:antitoxin FitA
MLLQVRNMPETLHRRLKARAAMEGLSMSQFVIREIERSLRRPTRQDVLDAIQGQAEVPLEEPTGQVGQSERPNR